MPRTKRPTAPLVRDSYPNLIVNQVLKAIQAGELKPGDVLSSENELIHQFQVGRTSVREALAGLEYMQVIRSEGGVTYVNGNVSAFFRRKILYHHQLDAKRQAALLETLTLLCPAFSAYAAQRASVNNKKHLRRLLQDMEGLFSKLDGPQSEIWAEELIRTHIQFLQALAEAAQNSIYGTIYQRLAPMLFSALWEIRDQTLYRQLYTSCQSLLQAVENGEEQEAQEAMEAYTRSVSERYRHFQLAAGEGADHV